MDSGNVTQKPGQANYIPAPVYLLTGGGFFGTIIIFVIIAKMIGKWLDAAQVT